MKATLVTNPSRRLGTIDPNIESVDIRNGSVSLDLPPHSYTIVEIAP